MLSIEAGQFLDGPRARTFCLALAQELDPTVESAVRAVERAVPEKYARLGTFAVPETEVAALASQVRAIALQRLDLWHDPMQLFPALGVAVDSAMPWQPPFIRDAVTALSPLRRALEPIAEAALASPAAAWWASDCDRASQWSVRAVRNGEPGVLSGAGSSAEILTKWRTLQEASEHRLREPDVSVEHAGGGEWWSTPNIWASVGQSARAPSSTRRLGALGAVELALVEDGFGDDEALLHRLSPAVDLRVYEVRSADDWATLVARYPMQARWSRRGDWWQSTGREEQWFLPDYKAVAEDFDAIHVSVLGYLSAAGRAIRLERGATVLAGWGPDETWWLTDDLAVAVEAEHWVRGEADEMHEWRRTPPTAPPVNDGY